MKEEGKKFVSSFGPLGKNKNVRERERVGGRERINPSSSLALSFFKTEKGSLTDVSREDIERTNLLPELALETSPGPFQSQDTKDK